MVYAGAALGIIPIRPVAVTEVHLRLGAQGYTMVATHALAATHIALWAREWLLPHLCGVRSVRRPWRPSGRPL
jgi:hypothetical protein